MNDVEVVVENNIFVKDLFVVEHLLKQHEDHY